MKQLDINYILEQTEKAVRSHELDMGRYTRWTRPDNHPAHRIGLNPYACADAVNILYMLNRFPKKESVRSAFIRTLQGLQEAESGLFTASTHHVIHTTAYCVDALYLLGASAKYPFKELEEFLNIRNVFEMLEERDWLTRGLGAHPGAGIYSVLTLSEAVDAKWENEYFCWMDKHCDPRSGFWRKEPVDDIFTSLQQLRDTANFLFNYEYAHRPFPYPMALIDSCLTMYLADQMPKDFGRDIRHFELDWVFCLNRASRQTSYRFEEIKAALNRFAEDYVVFLNELDWNQYPAADDLHLLSGMLSCLTELQQALPGKLLSKRPLQTVIDRHPF